MKTILSTCIFIVICIESTGQEIPIPKGYSIIDTTFGDLDNDRQDELAVAFNTKVDNEYESVPRELVIFKKNNSKWVVWKKSKKALFESLDGGMMGDPFENIDIKKGVLEISHYGGSSWKWGHIDKYRYLNGDFYLVGYSSIEGKLCEYWQTVDFNLSTGKIIVKKEYENCNRRQEVYKKENETFYKKGFKITFENRNQKEIFIVTPKHKHKVYISFRNND
jgi:hypothetical protein